MKDKTEYLTIGEWAKVAGLRDDTLRLRIKKSKVKHHHAKAHRKFFSKASIAHLLSPPIDRKAPAYNGLKAHADPRAYNHYRPKVGVFGMYARDEINLNYEPLKEY